MEKSELEPKQIFNFNGYHFDFKGGQGRIQPRMLANLKFENSETSHGPILPGLVASSP